MNDSNMNQSTIFELLNKLIVMYMENMGQLERKTCTIIYATIGYVNTCIYMRT